MAAENKLNIDLIINDKEALAKLKSSLADVEGTAKKGAEGITKGMVTAGAAIAAAVVVAQKLGEVMSEAIQAAAEQEEAINRLNNALRLQGTFSQETSRAYQQMATEMARNSRFADEAINQVQQRLAAIGGVLPDQMRAATQATLDLAAVLGIDLPQAAGLMAKAAQGETAMLERQLPVLKGLINDHTDFATVLRLVQQQIGGSAQADLNSFTAKQSNMKKAWGELLEEVGKFVTESPAVRKAMDALTEGLNNMATGIAKVREENPDLIAESLRKAMAVVQSFMQAGPAGLGMLAGKSLIEQIYGSKEQNEKDVVDLGEIAVKAEAAKQARLVQEDIDEIQRRQKFIQGEVEKIDQLRVVWDEWNNEKTAKAMAQTQAETDFLQLAIQTQQLAHESMWKSVGKMKDTFQAGIADMFKQMARGTFDAGEAFKQLGLKMVDILIDYGVQLAVNAALAKVFSAQQVGVSAATGAAVAAAWAPAAAAASLATLGGNAAAASAALTTTHALSRALLGGVPGLAEGGDVTGSGTVLVGERGPELLSLPQGARVTPLPQGAGRSSGGDINIHIEVHNPFMGTEEATRSVARILAKEVSEYIDVERERL